jgi:hypothetical protein
MKLSEAGHTSNIEYWKAVANGIRPNATWPCKKSSSSKNAC